MCATAFAMVIADLLSDVKVALRQLRKRPVFTLVVVVTLGLGIGANTAMFSILNSTILRALPYSNPDRLAVIFGSAERGSQQLPHPPATFLEYREQAQSFDDIAAAEAWGPTLAGEQRPEKISGLRVTPNLFRVLGVQPHLGRPLQDADAEEGASPAVVLSDGLARRLGGAEKLLGQRLRLDGVEHTVVGVMPESFVFPTFWVNNAEAWTALQWSASMRANRNMSTLRLFGRLREGLDWKAADAELRAIAARLATAHPASNAGLSARVVPLAIASGGVVRPTVLALFAAVGLLLLVACANLAGLLVARASERQGEVAVRLALGASVARLGGTLAAESLVLLAGGCLCGVGIAAWALALAANQVPAEALESIYGARTVAIDLTALAFTLGLSALVAGLFGFLPAIYAARRSPAAGMPGRGSSGDRRMGRFRSGLVVAQAALAFALIVFSGLLLASFRNMSRAEAGFEADGVLTFVAPVTGSSQAQPGRKAIFYRELVESLRALPGVAAASAVNHVPLLGDEWGTSFLVEGDPAPVPGEVPRAVYRVMMPGYLDVLGARLREGRDFTEADRADSGPVVIVNGALARRQWPDESPLGKRIRLGSAESDEPWREVVGVVADLQQQHWHTSVQEEVMLPFAQDSTFRESARAPFAMTMVVRVSGSHPEAVGPLVREAVWQLAPDVPLTRLKPLREGVDAAFWRPRMAASVGFSLALLSVLLSGLGIYGVLSQIVNSQQRVIGIRMALGASPYRVLRGLMLRGVFLVLGAAVLGLPIALAGGRMAESLLVGVASSDAAVLGIGLAILLALGLGATFLPARRAAAIDPVRALRME